MLISHQQNKTQTLDFSLFVEISVNTVKFCLILPNFVNIGLLLACIFVSCTQRYFLCLKFLEVFRTAFC